MVGDAYVVACPDEFEVLEREHDAELCALPLHASALSSDERLQHCGRSPIRHSQNLFTCILSHSERVSGAINWQVTPGAWYCGTALHTRADAAAAGTHRGELEPERLPVRRCTEISASVSVYVSRGCAIDNKVTELVWQLCRVFRTSNLQHLQLPWIQRIRI